MGGALYLRGSVTLTDCLIAENIGEGYGGGLRIAYGTTTLAGSTVVRDNVVRPNGSGHNGGGIAAESSFVFVGPDCRITGNTASEGWGGGVFRDGSAGVTLQGPHPSPIVVQNCHENCVLRLRRGNRRVRRRWLLPAVSGERADVMAWLPQPQVLN